jgi:ppGpp synthetase/RelA/SpoT-type nucleotidyltranferase
MDKMLQHSYAGAERSAILAELAANLMSEVQDAVRPLDHIDRVYFRVKSPNSFLSKALDPDTVPPYTNPLIEIEDQVAGRVLVFFLEDIEIVKDRLLRTFTTVERTHRKPTKDQEFGYESHHFICNIPPPLKPPNWGSRSDLPPTFELQVRTLFMHAYAEPQHNIAYKETKDLPSSVRRELAWIASSSWGADQAYSRVWAWYVSLHKETASPSSQGA